MLTYSALGMELAGLRSARDEKSLDGFGFGGRGQVIGSDKTIRPWIKHYVVARVR